jgi:diguanylate cyclase (GGDEF)-like protein
MNYYGLPEFIAYSMLLGISYNLIRQKREERLQYWLIGWELILVHSAIFMLFPPAYPFDVVARGTLILAGQSFILAAFYQEPTTTVRADLMARMGLSSALNLVFVVASAAYADLYPADPHPAVFYLLIAAGAASAIWLAAVYRPRSEWHFSLSVVLAVMVYAMQAWLLHAYGVAMASQWLMCWTYLAVAYFFIGRGTKLTMGVVFTALSFVLWGLVFPVYSLLMIYAPDVSAHVESGVWNLPKFLAAASMILILLEERVSSAVHLASHDQLTGLPNRRLYSDRFEQALANAVRNSAQFGVLVVDLDQFKQVNDTLGHQPGDELLRVVSARFRATLRRVDTLARTGGDEFMIILDGVHGAADADRVSEALRKCLDAPILLQDRPYYASASVGAAIYPDDGLTQIHLQAVADARMYDCKQQRQSQAPKKPIMPQQAPQREKTYSNAPRLAPG